MAAGLRPSSCASSVVVRGISRLLRTEALAGLRAASSAVPLGADREVVRSFATPRGAYASQGRPEAWVNERKDVRPGEGTGHQGHPTPCRLDSRFVRSVQLEYPPAIVHP